VGELELIEPLLSHPDKAEDVEAAGFHNHRRAINRRGQRRQISGDCCGAQQRGRASKT
jgi:hypothetical protein